MKKINIMDVTLRDGSYAINFQFSTADVKKIGKELEDLGYRYIEIGHGMGLGASSPKNGIALNSDWEYLSAARESIKNANYGMFCIPGVASVEEIEKAAEYGMKFIRIGTNIDKIKTSKEYIKKAKECGMEVMANYMKSYAMKPEKFAEQVLMSEDYGADVVYLVDSAGSMFPRDIESYYNEIRKRTKIRLGFHAHDNLGLALSNSLFAADLGFEFIDTSLQGLGRSAGNAATELFTICSMKKGTIPLMDYKRLLLFSKKVIYPLLHRKGINPIDTICGIAGFHSSYLNVVHKQAAMYGVNPLELIEEYSKADQLNMKEELLEDIARKLKKDQGSLFDVDFVNYFGNEQGN